MKITHRRVVRWTIIAATTILTLHLFVVIRSAEHLERARDHKATGRILEAAREYQTAIGYHAPFSPYCKAAAEELRTLAKSTAGTDPALAADLKDRLQRSVRGTRSLYQPHAKLIR
jgi:hypothetical protein